MSTNSGSVDEQMKQFWEHQQNKIDDIDSSQEDFKVHSLPLARIKKVMKLDDGGVKFISHDAPLVFAKACEIFILELTLRAWNHTSQSKRRTLQRNDIAKAVDDFDMFDFLIDIVPRPESNGTAKGGGGGSRSSGSSGGTGAPVDQEAYAAGLQQYMQALQQMSGGGDGDTTKGGDEQTEEDANNNTAAYQAYYEQMMTQNQQYMAAMQGGGDNSSSSSSSSSTSSAEDYYNNMMTMMEQQPSDGKSDPAV
jgi:histone H3/H4